MACRLNSAKPVSNPVLKLRSLFKTFNFHLAIFIRKCLVLRNGLVWFLPKFWNMKAEFQKVIRNIFAIVGIFVCYEYVNDFTAKGINTAQVYLLFIGGWKNVLSNLYHKSHLSSQHSVWSFRCSWSMACRRCSTYIFIIDLAPSFNRLGKNNCDTRGETLKFWDSVWLLLEIWWYLQFRPRLYVHPRK